MSSIERLPFMQWASVNRTERFVSVEPLSGYRMAYREDEGYIIYLPSDAGDDALGVALLQALDRSRFIWPRDERDFFNRERITQCDRNWQKDFMHRYGYKSKREAYKIMNWCEAKRSEGKISIKPHKQDGAEYFRNLPADDTVVIPATKDPIAAGAALRLALARCE
jgi:hypothetical protein